MFKSFIPSRRNFFRTCGAGLGSVALTDLFAQEQVSTGEVPLHFPAKAKRVIHLFMNGGPSHVDTFDPKEALEKFDGQTAPTKNLRTERPTGNVLKSPYKFQQYGESGLPVSEIFSQTAEHMDDICVIRSMHADVPNHEPSLMLMNTGESRLVRPSMGSWISYGLGTANANLPSFVTMCPGGNPKTGKMRFCQGSTKPPISTQMVNESNNSSITFATATSPVQTSVSNLTCCSNGTVIMPRHERMTDVSNHALNHSNWRTGCKTRQPRHSISNENHLRRERCMAKVHLPDKH